MPIKIGMAAAKNVRLRAPEKIRVLIADDEGHSSRKTMDFFNQNGFDCRLVANGTEAKKTIAKWRPRVLIADLLLPDGNAFALLQFCQQPTIRELGISVLILSGHNSKENLREAYARGAKDYLARPVMHQDLLNRVVFHCRTHREIEAAGKPEAKTDSLKIADLMISQTMQGLSFEETLFAITQMATLKLKGSRCSIIHQVTHEKGIILAANDKYDIAGLQIDLKKYPEVQLVTNTQKMIVIDNLGESRALAKIKKEFRDVDFNSMIICPIHYGQKIFGVISMRLPSDQIRIPDRDVHFLQYTAKVVSLYLSTQDYEKIAKYGLVGVS